MSRLPGNPYDGHTLAKVIPAIEALVGNVLDRVFVDAGYRGHNAPPESKFKVFTSGQKRRVTPQIKRRCDGAPPSSRSSAISRPSTAWAATISPIPPAMPSTPCWPPRRLQLPPPHQVAEALVAHDPDCPRPAAQTSSRLKSGKFTADFVLFPGGSKLARLGA